MKKTILAALFITVLSLSAKYASAQFSVTVGVSIRTPPPVIPVYTQPACPVDGWLWTPGYWGPHIGFYGGVNYGYGYGGVGFVGGEWHGSVFRYNTAVVNVNTTVVHNTYINRTVIVKNTTVNRSAIMAAEALQPDPLHRNRWQCMRIMCSRQENSLATTRRQAAIGMHLRLPMEAGPLRQPWPG